MYKTLFFVWLIFISLHCMAQVNKTAIPMKKGKVHYEKGYIFTDSLKQDELFKRALKWFKIDVPNAEKIKTSADKTNGEITGTSIFKIVTSSTGNYYLVRSVFKIMVYNSGYTFEANEFYEKPIESGISNEYSKIEYRWWDYRQGKPWSAEDETLFKGIISDEAALMASLEEQLHNK